MKVQYRIVYLLVAFFLLYTLLFSGFIYYSITQYAFTDFYKRLEIRAVTAAKIQLEDTDEVDHIKEIRQEYLEKLPNQKEYVIQINSGEVNPADVPEDVPVKFVKEIIDKDTGSYSNGNIYYSGIHYTNDQQQDYVVIISAENYYNSHHLAYLRNLLFSSLIYALLLILILSFFFSRTLIQPINQIIKSVKRISSENLHMRLKVPRHNDSLSTLILTFNDMLNRLETSFETQKNFVSNASHELNTPLTSIIGEADLALSKERPAEEYKEAITTMLKEAEKLDKKTKALLLLAETGFDGRSQRFDKVRMDQLVMDVKDTVEKINQGSKIYIDFSRLPETPLKLKIKGNEQLLHLALSNIVLNACKYSDNKPVNISLGASDKQVEVIVRDAGIGIPAHEAQYIFDPYFRASNAKGYEGYGIGLPLARNIIEMHDGELFINSEEQRGTIVEIRLPLGNYTL